MGEVLYFIASKAVGYALRPEAWGMVFLILAVWRGRRWAVVATLWWGALWALPLGVWLIAPLEEGVAVPPPLGSPAAQARLAQADGIIVLGGWEDLGVMDRWGQPAVGGAAERILVAATLARAAPDLPLIVTGGRAQVRATEVAADDPLGAMIATLAGSPERILREGRSRSTAEHPRRIAEELGEGGGPDAREGRWILVTSAAHMRRARATFCTAGWSSLDPWPVDFRSASQGARVRLSDRLELLSAALQEWVGLAGYRATGRISGECL